MSIAAATKKQITTTNMVFPSFLPAFVFCLLSRLPAILFLTALFKGWNFSGFDRTALFFRLGLRWAIIKGYVNRDH